MTSNTESARGKLSAGAIKYLYEWEWQDEDSGRVIKRYPILKRTAKFVYINHRRYDYWIVGSYHLPDYTDWVIRESIIECDELCRIPISGFNNEGRFYHRSRRLFLYLDMPEEWVQITSGNYTPKAKAALQCFSFFGFDVIPSAIDFEKAYRRKACKLHPDAGGTKESFQELERFAEECRKLTATR